MVSGLICAQGEIDTQGWLDTIAPGRDRSDLLVKEAFDTLAKLHAATQSQLSSNVLDFSLLLAPDEAPIEERIDSLAEWCQGYLLGLSAGGIADLDKLVGDSGEIIRDLVEISRAGSYELEGGEVDEESYLQLTEYVRTGVLLVLEELHPIKAPPLGDVTIH